MIQVLLGLRKFIDLDRPLGENLIDSSQVVCSSLALNQHHMNHPWFSPAVLACPKHCGNTPGP